MSKKSLLSRLILTALYSSRLWASRKHPRPRTTPKSESKAAATELIDLNSATKEQLVALPGVGEAMPKKSLTGGRTR